MNEDLSEFALSGNNIQGEKIDYSNMDTPFLELYKKFASLQTRNYVQKSKEIFYKQAKLMENFEYDFNERPVRRKSYVRNKLNCNYANFTYSDFKAYFSWRTRIRKNIYENIEFEYEQIYINELINCIGCKDEIDAINKLIDFWKKYKEYNIEWDFSYRMERIIKAFYIISDIEIPYIEFQKKFPRNIETYNINIAKIYKGDYTNQLDFLDNISRYSIYNSKFMQTEYGFLLKESVEEVFKRLNQVFKEHDISMFEMLFYKREDAYWYNPLVEYDLCKEIIKAEKTINGMEKYSYEDKKWKCVNYRLNNTYQYIFTYILKATECFVRDYLGYRKLNMPDQQNASTYYCFYRDKEAIIINKLKNMDLESIIHDTVFRYLRYKRIPENIFKEKKNKSEFDYEEKMEIKFHEENFQNIREKSDEIRDALIVDEEVQDETIAHEEKQLHVEEKETNACDSEQDKQEEFTERNEYKQFLNKLTEIEKTVVQILLERQDAKNRIMEIAKKENIMFEVLISNINEKALETIGDTIVEDDCSGIYSDYEEEFKKI